MTFVGIFEDLTEDEQADTLKGLTLALHNRANYSEITYVEHNQAEYEALTDLMEFQGLGKPTF